jgi:hypothetical protein
MFEPKTEQEVFDIVARHLLTQGRRAAVDLGYNDGQLNCLYRTPEGLKCAAGCLIPDEAYDESMEGIMIGSLIHNGTKLAHLKPFMMLLNRLQGAHDEAEDDDFMPGLIDVARRHDLDVSVLKEFSNAEV